MTQQLQRPVSAGTTRSECTLRQLRPVSALHSVSSSISAFWTGTSPLDYPPQVTTVPAGTARRIEHVHSPPHFEFCNDLGVTVLVAIGTRPTYTKGDPRSPNGKVRPEAIFKPVASKAYARMLFTKGTITAYMTLMIRHPYVKHKYIVLVEDMRIQNLDIVTVA